MWNHGKFQKVLLRTSCILHLDPSLGISWGSCYILWSSCNHSVNMWALLLDCIIVEQRAVIRFLWSVGVKPSEIHRRMLAQYGENCIMQRKVYQWVERFQSGRTSVVEEDHSGRLTTSWTADNVEWVNAVVQEDRQITVTDMADLQTMKRSRTCCGFACNQKHSLQMASGSSWTEVNVWRNWGIMLKNDCICSCVPLAE
jgi:hypothetical protein